MYLSYFFFSIPRIVQLRRDMIDQKEGETNFAIKIHYDNMVSENNIFSIACSFLRSFSSFNAYIDTFVYFKKKVNFLT